MPASQALRSRLTTAGGPSPVAVAVLVLLGLAMLAHPLVLFPHFGQTPYSVGAVERVNGGAVEQDAVVDYADLPAAAKSAFDGARSGPSAMLWSGDDERAVDVLIDHQYVQQDGRYYEYGLLVGHNPVWSELLVRLLLTVAGSVLVTFGGLVAATGRWRPLTPLRTLPVLAAVVLGVSGMHAYDVVVSGARGSIPQSLAPFGFLLLPVAVLGVGSLVRQRGWRVLKPVVAVGVVALAAGAVVRGDPVAAPLALAAYVAIVGAPWLALGYWLTDESADPVLSSNQ